MGLEERMDQLEKDLADLKRLLEDRPDLKLAVNYLLWLHGDSAL